MQRLRELGWIESRTIAIDYRWGEGSSERAAEIPAGTFDGYTDEELVADAARRARELGIAGPVAVEDDNKKSL